MNNNRLSTNAKESLCSAEARDSLLTELTKFLTRPSNYESRNGRIWIISENRYRGKEFEKKKGQLHLFLLRVLY